MDKHQIKKLLDRYFEGKTSLEEEQQLKQWFVKHSVDPEWASFKDLFVFLSQEKQQEIHSGFKLPSRKKPAVIRTINIRYWAVAAVVLLSFSSWLLLYRVDTSQTTSQGIDWSKYEPKDEKQALKLTIEALKKTSVAMQHGTRKVGREVKGIGGLVDFN